MTIDRLIANYPVPASEYRMRARTIGTLAAATQMREHGYSLAQALRNLATRK